MVDDAPGSKKRGPKGLSLSKPKKRKVSDPDPEESTRVLDADSKTIAISGDVDEDDDIGQLVALYHTAVEHLQRRKVQDAVPIINGTIHEADRILRNKPSEIKLSYEFHAVYANALLDLSQIMDDSTANDGEKAQNFIDAATERCNLGLESGVGEGMSQLHLTKAKCICSSAQLSLAAPKCELTDVQVKIEEAMTLVDGAFKVSHYAPLRLNTAFEIIQDFADSLLDVQPETHQSMNRWVEAKWTKVLTEDQENVSALEGCGRVWLSLAQPLLTELDEMNAGDANTDVADKLPAQSNDSIATRARQCLETSVELLDQAVRCAEKSNVITGELLCLLAEATISLANTFDEGPQYEKLEADTIKYLKRAQATEGFDMPERFVDMLEDNDEAGDSKADVSD